MTKMELYQKGMAHIKAFAASNLLPMPYNGFKLVPDASEWPLDQPSCYTDQRVYIHVRSCPEVSQKSCPAAVLDDTPYGRLAFEYAHHIESTLAVALEMEARSYEKALTKNGREWFGSGLRLFITNPHLLKLVRPKTYAELRTHFHPIVKTNYIQTLEAFNPPAEIIDYIRKKVQANVEKTV